MRMSRWGKKLIAIGITACVLAAFLFGYLRVNREYPLAERCVYTVGDTFTVNDLGIQNNGGELVTVSQLKERFPDAEIPSMIVNGQTLPEEKSFESIKKARFGRAFLFRALQEWFLFFQGRRI